MEKKKNKRHHKGAAIAAEIITQAMEKVADVLEEYPSEKIAKGIVNAVKKYLNSDYTNDDGITLYNELMDAMEIGAEKISGANEDDGVGYKY